VDLWVHLPRSTSRGFAFPRKDFYLRSHTFSVQVDGVLVEPQDAPETLQGIREVVLIKHTEGGY